MAVSDAQVRAAITGLLRHRRPAATICPSEVARALAPTAWRPLMSQVRTVAFDMAQNEVLDICQKGHPVAPSEAIRGPIRLALKSSSASKYPTTPDGRYFVVRARLWRRSNPHLPDDVRQALVRQLMDARRALRGTSTESERRAARSQVDHAKTALGERGAVWWTDGAPDFNRKLVKNTPYRGWFAALG